MKKPLPDTPSLIREHQWSPGRSPWEPLAIILPLRRKADTAVTINGADLTADAAGPINTNYAGKVAIAFQHTRQPTLPVLPMLLQLTLGYLSLIRFLTSLPLQIPTILTITSGGPPISIHFVLTGVYRLIPCKEWRPLWQHSRCDQSHLDKRNAGKRGQLRYFQRFSGPDRSRRRLGNYAGRNANIPEQPLAASPVEPRPFTALSA